MRISKYKTNEARNAVENWVDFFAANSALNYEKLNISTAFGNTRILAVNHEKRDLKPLLFLPGARTCGIFWDVSNHLQILGNEYRIYLLDVVGQPSLSDGNCPRLASDDYGNWLKEVCEKLNFEKGAFIGASFGGLLIFKLAAVAPECIEKAVLMNPVGLSYISLSPWTLYNTLKPVYFPTRANVETFMHRIVFSQTEKPEGDLWKRIADYIEISVRDFEFAGDYPTKLTDAEILKLKAETHLLVGDSDALIPHQNTVKRAQKLLPNLKNVEILPNIGHGIEISKFAIQKLKTILAMIVVFFAFFDASSAQTKTENFVAKVDKTNVSSG